MDIWWREREAILAWKEEGEERVEVRECTVTKLLFSSENMSLWLTWDRARMCFDSVKEVFSLDFFRSLIGREG